jgi:hypothetical protein
MELLPVDHSELVTKQDLSAEIAALRAEMHDLFREQTNRIVTFVVPTMLTGIGLAFVAARFGA